MSWVEYPLAEFIKILKRQLFWWKSFHQAYIPLATPLRLNCLGNHRFSTSFFMLIVTFCRQSKRSLQVTTGFSVASRSFCLRPKIIVLWLATWKFSSGLRCVSIGWVRFSSLKFHVRFALSFDCHRLSINSKPHKFITAPNSLWRNFMVRESVGLVFSRLRA